jgi:hypothetical protein
MKVEADLAPDTILDIAEAETLSGDIRDALLTHVRSIKVPWAMLSEEEQQETIDAISKTAQNAVRQIGAIIARRGFPHVLVGVEKWTVKDGIKLEVTASSLVENIHRLAEHGNSAAILVLTDPSDYIGERAPAVADKDQPDLPIDKAA